MKLQDLGEREIISRIRNSFSESPRDVIIGIGDDAAVIQHGKKNIIITKDLLFEGIHFLTALHPPYFLGRKSLNVNLSDVAAMGGVPKYALVGLGLPPEMDSDWLDEYFSGFKAAGKEAGVSLVGGDVSGSKKISISVTVIGEGKKIIKRAGAREGHLIFVSGSLGDSKQGLILLKKGYRLGDDRKTDPFIKAFLDPVPQIALGEGLSRLHLASAMIDVSDGLSTDLYNLCQESGVGAEIFLDKLPLSAGIRHLQRQPYRLALNGGEDYQLLFTVPPRSQRNLLRLQKNYRITFIGKIIKKKEIFLVNRQGERNPLKIRGYQHFIKS